MGIHRQDFLGSMHEAISYESHPLILSILHQAKGGVMAAEICEEHDGSTVLQVAGEVWEMAGSMITQIKIIEDENRRLKRCSPS